MPHREHNTSAHVHCVVRIQSPLVLKVVTHLATTIKRTVCKERQNGEIKLNDLLKKCMFSQRK
jgi:hypothetical protein